MTQVTDHDFPPAVTPTAGWGPPAAPPPPPGDAKARRSWPVKKIVAGLAVLFVGVGIGSAGGTDNGQELAQIRADRDTLQATLIDTRTQAARDVADAEAKPPQVVTQTVTKEVTPPACLEALDLAGQIFDINADHAGNLGDYFAKVSKLAGGSTLGFLNGLASATETLTAQTNRATSQVQAVSPSWKAARDKCQGGA